MPTAFQIVPEVLASILGLSLALVVLRLGHPPVNRPLAALIFLDGLSQLGWAASDILWPNLRVGNVFVVLGILAFTLTVLPYMLIVRTLATPLARPFRRRRVAYILGAFAVAFGAVPCTYLLTHLGSFDTQGVGSMAAPILIGIVAAAGVTAIVYVIAFVAAVSAFRRAGRNTAMRAKARAYAIAFGARDLIYVIAVVLNLGLVAVLKRSDLQPYVWPVWSFATIAFVVLLSYGFLKTQLFDIDIRIKRGISRSTVATIGIIGVLIAAKLVESFLNRELGFIAGAVAAGLMLFLTPRLNKLGDKVADTALPKVQATPAYLQFKKLEVYKAAVESAHETGGIDARQRLVLEKLRTKLALGDVDCAAIEAEVMPASNASASTHAA